MCCSRQWALVPFGTKVLNRVDETDYLTCWRGHDSSLFGQVSLPQDPLRRIAWTSHCSVLGFDIVWKLPSNWNWLKVIYCYWPSVLLTALLLSTVEFCWPAPFVLLSTGWSIWMKLGQSFSDLMVLRGRLLVGWAAICGTLSLPHILMRMIAMIGTFLMCLLIPTSTFVPSFARTSTA